MTEFKDTEIQTIENYSNEIFNNSNILWDRLSDVLTIMDKLCYEIHYGNIKIPKQMDTLYDTIEEFLAAADMD